MEIRFYHDPSSGQPHIFHHAVGEDEVQMFWRRRAKTGLVVKGPDAIGQTSGGRYLRVTYVPEPDSDSAFVITAYELKGKPLLAYKRRMRRRHV
jgi:hypothetical protein